MTGGGCAVCKIVGLLLVIGALNWGLVGLFELDLVGRLLGVGSAATRVVYTLVGVAGLLKLISCFKACPCQCAKQ